jgi:predicted DNA-binding transcriptional regulator AlpA
MSVQNVPSKHHLDKRADALIAEPGDDDELLSTRQVALWLQVSDQWLEIGRHKNYGPRFVRLSPQRVRYRRGDVRAFLASRTYNHTLEYTRKEDEEKSRKADAKPKRRA